MGLFAFVRSLPEVGNLRLLLAEERRRTAALTLEVAQLRTKVADLERENAVVQADNEQLRKQVQVLRDAAEKRRRTIGLDDRGRGGWMSR